MTLCSCQNQHRCCATKQVARHPRAQASHADSDKFSQHCTVSHVRQQLVAAAIMMLGWQVSGTALNASKDGQANSCQPKAPLPGTATHAMYWQQLQHRSNAAKQMERDNPHNLQHACLAGEWINGSRSCEHAVVINLPGSNTTPAPQHDILPMTSQRHTTTLTAST